MIPPLPNKTPSWAKHFGLALVLLGAPAVAWAQQRPIVSIDRSPQLFAVLAALQAAGHEADLSSAGLHPVRLRLAGELRRLQSPAAEAIRQFYREHRQADPGATLAQYVSLALVLGPPPNFEFQMRRTDLPPDVRPIEAFRELLVSFYQEAGIEQLWRRIEPEYDPEISRLQEPLGRIVIVATSYVREILSGSHRRTFSIFVEPMVGTRINFRSYGDHYTIVLSLGGQIPLGLIRHAFLHFLVDTFAAQHPLALDGKDAVLHVAARAPQLPTEYRDDFSHFLIECLVRAIELRLDRPSDARLAAALDEADRSGFILVRTLYGALQQYEKAEPALQHYFPDLMRAINPAQEARRLQDFQFASGPAPSEGIEAPPSRAVPGLEQVLIEGERYIAAQDAPAATAAFEKVLAAHPEHPRALYGLAVAAVLQGDAPRAKELFQRLVRSDEEGGAPSFPGSPAERMSLIRAWSHVYLGRLYDMEGQRELALSEYRAALAVPGAPETAKSAAQRGLKTAFRPSQREGSSERQP